MAQATPEPTSLPEPTPQGEGTLTHTPSANDNDTAVKTKRTSSPVNTSMTANDNDTDFPVTSPARPLHTQTQQTLSPTSEFMRYVLAALPSRYVLRGLFKTIFGTEEATGKLRTRLSKLLHAPGEAIERMIHGKGVRDVATIKNNLGGLEAGFYGASLGLGSMALTTSYSRIVQRDILSLFAETVGDELGVPADEVRFSDLKRSQNRIVTRTLENYREKQWSRYATDLLFFPAGWMRKEGLVDFALGLKGVQLFVDTWKRKTTMFEDLVTFVNNKINPRNGIGQPITVGEVFDLYQHYADTFSTVKMFTNVLERGTGEGAIWAKNQPIFQRMAQLLNDTYAYKHKTIIDPKTGHTIHTADFTLPKFIYLLGHDLIDPAQPERTLLLLEIANRHGIAAVKQSAAQLSSGARAEDILKTYPVTLPTLHETDAPVSDKNGVIAKGSTLQLDRAEGAASPTSTINVDSIVGHAKTTRLNHAPETAIA